MAAKAIWLLCVAICYMRTASPELQPGDLTRECKNLTSDPDGCAEELSCALHINIYNADVVSVQLRFLGDPQLAAQPKVVIQYNEAENALGLHKVADMPNGQILGPSFSPRCQIQHQSCDSETTFRISPVLDKDVGRYVCEVTIRWTDDGSTTTHIGYTDITTTKCCAPCEVLDHLTTQDKNLHMSMNPDAVVDNSTGKWSIELQCGSFNFQGNPPYSLEWTTPDNNILTTTRYEEGYFRLTLTNPLSGGRYMCRVPSGHIPDSCRVDDDDDSVQAVLFVNTADVRFILMERQMDEMRTSLQQTSSRMQQLMEEMQQQITAVQEKIYIFHETPEQCRGWNHKVLNDEWRLKNKGSGDKCDRNLEPGWYRFKVGNRNAVIPTTCVPGRKVQGRTVLEGEQSGR